MTAFPQIVLGTYEEFVLGYHLKHENEYKKNIIFHQTFATHSHQASVRCVATHKNLVASSGADEYINIYDMIAMEITAVINYHNSTVTGLSFTPDGSHLVSANQNGDIAIFQCKDWTLVKLWKEAHKHSCGVTSLSVHPSGSLLLTTGADNILRFWNLIKGRLAYASNYSKKCSVGNSLNFATWNRNGNLYAVCIGNKVEIYQTATAGVVYEVNAKTRITSCAFTKKNLFCVGTEEGTLEIYSVLQKSLLLTVEAHKARVKCLVSFDINFFEGEKKKLQNYIVSVDSKGEIKLWYLKKMQRSCSLTIKSETNCDCRITCLTIVAPEDVKTETQDSNEISTDEPVVDNFVDEKSKSSNFAKKKKVMENGSSKIHSTASKNIRSSNNLPLEFENSDKVKKRKNKNLNQVLKRRKVQKGVRQKNNH